MVVNIDNKVSELRATYSAIVAIFGESQKVKDSYVQSLDLIIMEYNPIADRARFVAIDEKEQNCLAWLCAAKQLKAEFLA